MSDRFPAELLSAYVDGEVTDSERAAVEEWIARSADARRRLNDFRRLSAQIQELPPLRAPGEFAATVMHLAERRMLLPEAPAPPARWKQMARRALAPLATAAAAVLVVWLILPDRQSSRPRMTDARSPSAPSPSDEALAFTPGSSGADPASIERPPAGSPAREAQPPTPAGSGHAAPAPLAPEQVPPRAGKAADSSTALAEGAASAVWAEEIREVAEEAGSDRVAFLTVLVDSKDGLTLFQNTLEQQSVHAFAPEAGQTETIANDRGGRLFDDSQALLVVADIDKIVRAFDQFRAREKKEVAVRVEPPLEVAAFDEHTQERLRKLSSEPEGPADAASAPVQLPAAARAHRKEPGAAASARIVGDRPGRAGGASAPPVPRDATNLPGTAGAHRAKQRPVRVIIRVARPATEPAAGDEQNAPDSPDVSAPAKAGNGAPRGR